MNPIIKLVTHKDLIVIFITKGEYLKITTPSAPASIEETLFYKKIEGIPNDKDGLLHKVTEFIKVANPLVDSVISGPFKRFTLHNRDHAKKLIHLAEHISSKETLKEISAVECLIFIYASYLHDMGLAVSDSEFSEFINSNALNEILDNWPHLRNNLDFNRQLLAKATDKEKPQIELTIGEIYRIAATEYYRPIHAKLDRYQALIKRIKDAAPSIDFFEINGISFEDELIDICASHNLDAAVLAELKSAHEERFPRRFPIGQHIINTQFISALLRITDILDFDFERTPKILFDSLGLKHNSLPGSEVSLNEWEKHLSVQQLTFGELEIVVKARCKHPAIEAAIRNFCIIIENEIRSTLSVIRRNEQDILNKYSFRLATNVRAEIKSEGYKYIDLSLSLDESAVMSILMGTSLYRTPFAAIRELIQNGVDACSVRQTLRHDLGKGKVDIYCECDEDGNNWICVRDNGIGMDEHVLSSYFFKVGRSYYSSNDFNRLFNSTSLIKPTISSRFGIGFLSTFMLADLVEIETRPTPLSVSESDVNGLNVTIERLGALVYVQENHEIQYGTTIRLRIKNTFGTLEDITNKIIAYVKESVVRPNANLTVTFFKRTLDIEPNEYYALKNQPMTPQYIPDGLFKIIELDLSNHSEFFSGKVILFFVRNDVDDKLNISFANRHLSFGKNVGKTNIIINAKEIVQAFIGTRITVGGFRMQFPALGKLLRHGKTILPVIYDLDITPGEHISFDVARTRIIDENLKLRILLKEAIQSALKNKGIWDDLSENVQRAIDVGSKSDPFRISHERLRKQNQLVTDENLLTNVLECLPKENWPVSIHREVAEKLSIPNGLAYRAISTLIVESRVSNPNLKEFK